MCGLRPPEPGPRKENVGAPTFKVLLEGYIKDIVPVLPQQVTGLRGEFPEVPLACSKHRA
jgi:hypothetical protein